MTFNSQESDPNIQNGTTEETPVVADQASSPDVTEGASSSDAAAEGQENTAEAIRDAFLEKYGEDEPKEGDDTPAEGDDKPKDEPNAERKEAPEAKDTKDDNAEADEGDDDKFRITDEEFKSLPEGARQRIGHLNARAKKAERQLSDKDAQIETMQASHKHMQDLETFVSDNGIQPENMSAAFGMMAKMARGDFEGFLSDIEPFITHARQSTGKQAADDLQEQVDGGYMTEEAAQQLTQARAAQARAEGEAKRLRESQTAQQQQDQASQDAGKIVNAINVREQELMASDPDYARLSEAVQRNVKMALDAGARPATPADAIKMIDTAFENAKFSAPKPKPAPTPKRPSASTIARGAEVPASTRDAIINSMENYAPST